MRKKLYSAVFISILAFTLSAHATPVAVVDSSGQLTGWNGLVVGGLDYNVTFIEGSFETIFGPTGANLDFNSFSNPLDAVAAQALAQAYNSNPLYLNDPQLTFGIDETTQTGGFIWTPFQITNGVDFFYRATTTRGGVSHINRVKPLTLDTTNEPGVVFADWTIASPVPVPAAIYLMGTGLIGLMGVSRRKKQPVA